MLKATPIWDEMIKEYGDPFAEKFGLVRRPSSVTAESDPEPAPVTRPAVSPNLVKPKPAPRSVNKNGTGRMKMTPFGPVRE